MDAKITKSRIGHMLSYDWIKILALCAAVVVVWVLLFTTLAPRATRGQTFEIYVYPNVRMGTFGDLGSLHGDNALTYEALSYDVLDMSANTTLTDDTVNTVLSAHFAAGQGDVVFISSERYDSGQKDENDNAVMTSDLEQFLAAYVYNCTWLGGDAEYPLTASEENANTQDYLTACAAYLSQYYTGDITETSAEQDRQAIETDFRARADGDNRYKKESQILAGLEKEYGRIENLRVAYNNVVGYLGDGTLSVTEVDLTVRSETDVNGDGTVNDSDTVQKKGYFSFDLSDVPGIDYMFTTSRVTDENGAWKGDSVNMIVLNTRLQEEALRYEQVTFLDYIVKECARRQELES